MSKVLNSLVIGTLVWVVVWIFGGAIVAFIINLFINASEAIYFALTWIVYFGPISGLSLCWLGIPLCALVVFFVRRSRQRRRTPGSS